jgi:hypothetical protein
MRCRPAAGPKIAGDRPGLSTPLRSAVHRMPIRVDKSGGQLVDKALPAPAAGG